MTFKREADLARPVARFLRNRTFEKQLSEVSFYEYKMDMYGYSSREELTVAVELKLSKWSRAVDQALLYQLCSDLVYIAMPTNVARKIDLTLLQEHGLGLIAVEKDRCRELLSPRVSSVLRQSYRDGYRALFNE